MSSCGGSFTCTGGATGEGATGWSAGHDGRHLAAAVAELEARARSLVVQRRDERLQPLADVVAPHPGQLLLDPSLGRHGAERDRGHPDGAAARPEVADQRLVGHALGEAEACCHRREHDAVAELERPEVELREEEWVPLRHQSPQPTFNFVRFEPWQARAGRRWQW